MNGLIKGPQDFWTGVMYLVFGSVALILARDYGVGSAARMGPGYFPVVLGGLLVLFGAVALGRSFLRPGEPIGEIAWKPLALVTVATILFAVLLRSGGLLLALPALILASAAASAKFKLGWRAVAALMALVAFCALVFVKGLGVPMPLIGSWFGN
jgi:putative tricarboxylic transport membrane protein